MTEPAPDHVIAAGRNIGNLPLTADVHGKFAAGDKMDSL